MNKLLAIAIFLCTTATIAAASPCEMPRWESIESGYFDLPASIDRNGVIVLDPHRYIVVSFAFFRAQHPKTSWPMNYLPVVEAGEGGVVDEAVSVRVVGVRLDRGDHVGRRDDTILVDVAVGDSAYPRVNHLRVVLCAEWSRP